MEDFTVTCPLVPGVPHLVSGACSSPRIFGLGFLQTPPRGDALALLLAFGCANTWHGDLHPVSSVPCPAHTIKLSSGGRALIRCATKNRNRGRRLLQRLVRRWNNDPGAG